VADTGGQRAAAEREQDRVDAVEPFDELQPDGARAFAGVEVFAVLHEQRVAAGRDLAGAPSRVLDVALDEFDGGSEPANAIDLRGIGACARDHCYANTACPAAICERLPEIAGAGADRDFGPRASCETGHYDLGPTSLEASDRVCGLEFDDDFAAQQVSKSGTVELRRVAKHL